jgi:hypothetical protein
MIGAVTSKYYPSPDGFPEYFPNPHGQKKEEV